MAYESDKKPLELTALTSLADDDTVIVGDTSDLSEVVKSITWGDLKTLINALIAANGSGVTVEIPTGAVNADNTIFSVTAEPQWVVADGVVYFDGAGYSYSSLSVTMDIPPSISIYAII